MCNRGTWRGFHSRYLQTPDGQQSPLVVMEQCTECGNYRAQNVENCPYVPNDSSEKQRDELPDPAAEDGGSVWGSNDESSPDTDSW